VKETKEARRERQAQEEWTFVDVLRRAGNIVQAEVRVCTDRMWRVDYLITANDRPVAVEIQGFGFGHVGRAGWLRDIDKAQSIAANGWAYVPVTREQVANGDALEALARCGVKVEE
jgi:hypothetical protein